MGWLEIQNLKYLENRTFFYEIKKLLTCTSDSTFYRYRYHYRFVAEVTFKFKSYVKNLCKKASQKIWALSRLSNYLKHSEKTNC